MRNPDEKTEQSAYGDGLTLLIQSEFPSCEGRKSGYRAVNPKTGIKLIKKMRRVGVAVERFPVYLVACIGKL